MFSTPKIQASKSVFHLSLYEYTKNPAVKKWHQFELIYAVNLEYIVTSNFVLLSTILLTLYVQYTKNTAAKKWLPYEPFCAVYLEHIVASKYVILSQILLTLYLHYTKNPAITSGFHLSLYLQYI